MVDCAKNGGDDGCKGGNDFYVYSYLQSHKFMKDADYPYTKHFSGSCSYNSKKGVYNDGSYTKVA